MQLHVDLLFQKSTTSAALRRVSQRTFVLRGVGIPGLSRCRTVTFDFLHTASICVTVHSLLTGFDLRTSSAASALCTSPSRPPSTPSTTPTRRRSASRQHAYAAEPWPGQMAEALLLSVAHVLALLDLVGGVSAIDAAAVRACANATEYSKEGEEALTDIRKRR